MQSVMTSMVYQLIGQPKACKACKKTKPANAFHRAAHIVGGYHSTCKACRSKLRALTDENRKQRERRRLKKQEARA